MAERESLFAFLRRQRRRPVFVRRWSAYWVWNFHRCDICAWRFNLGKVGIGRYRRGF